MKKLFLIAAAMLLGLAASAADYVEVTGTNVRLRTQPSLQGAIYKDANNNPIYPKKGAVLECYGDFGDFYKVKFKGTELYISKQFSRPATGKKATIATKGTAQQAKNVAAPAAKVAAPAAVIVTGTDVRLRSGASLKSPALQDANGKNLHPIKGQRLKCVGQQGDFYKVVFGGLTAYISKKFAVPAE